MCKGMKEEVRKGVGRTKEWGAGGRDGRNEGPQQGLQQAVAEEQNLSITPRTLHLLQVYN